MDKRKGLMGHMEVVLKEDIGLIGMTQSEMVGSWIHLTRWVMTVGSIVVLV